MKLYWWVVNTDQDSGPTNYIVIARDVEAARQSIVTSALTRPHHLATICTKSPSHVIPHLQPISI